MRARLLVSCGLFVSSFALLLMAVTLEMFFANINEGTTAVGAFHYRSTQCYPGGRAFGCDTACSIDSACHVNGLRLLSNCALWNAFRAFLVLGLIGSGCSAVVSAVTAVYTATVIKRMLVDRKVMGGCCSASFCAILLSVILVLPDPGWEVETMCRSFNTASLSLSFYLQVAGLLFCFFGTVVWFRESDRQLRAPYQQQR